MTHPDAIGRRYLELTEGCGPRGINLYVSTGDYCAHCPPGLSGKPRLNTNRERWICDRCNKPWEPRSQWVLKSGVPRGHPETHRFRMAGRGSDRRRIVEPRYAARPGAQHATPRSDSSDRRLAEHVDRLRRTQALVETVPAPIPAAAWCLSVHAWLVYLLLERPPEVKPYPGYTGDGDGVDRVVEWGAILRPHLGEWTRERVTQGREQARAWVQWRLRTPRWLLEETVPIEEWMKPSEAAELLCVAERTIYDLIKSGALEAFERGRPDAKRRTLGVTRRSVRAEMRRRNIRETVEKTREFLDR